MRFHLTIMRPDDKGARFNVQAFHEVIETLAYGVSMLGHDVSYRANVFVPEDAINIVLGAQFAKPETPFPRGRTILYNLEQLGGNKFHTMSPELSDHHMVWDYSVQNLGYWTTAGVDAHWVPIGYVPQLSRIVNASYPDIDVLFYGANSPRRDRVIKELQAMKDIKFHYAIGFGKERDPAIARSKVILCMHYYEQPQLFEQVRVSYLLSNRKAVVCEFSDDFPPGLQGGVKEVPYFELAQACRDLVKDVDQRLGYQHRGYELFSKLREVDILRGALRHNSQQSTAFAQVTNQ